MINGIAVRQIFAITANSTLGKDGKLPWNYFKEDMQRFKAKTMNHVVIVGRKTFDTFSKPLEDRFHVVLTRSLEGIENHPFYKHPDVTFVSSVEEALKVAVNRSKLMGKGALFVIGGAMVYSLFAPYTDYLDVTLTNHLVPGDTFYPATFIEASRQIRIGASNGDSLGNTVCVSNGHLFTCVWREGSFHAKSSPTNFMYDFLIYKRQSPNHIEIDYGDVSPMELCA